MQTIGCIAVPNNIKICRNELNDAEIVEFKYRQPEILYQQSTWKGNT